LSTPLDQLHPAPPGLPFPQSNWADGQGKDVYVRNYYSTKAFFDKLPGV